MTLIEKFNIRPKKNPTFLIAPLDWGLGHATRCIPLITYLNSIGCEVIIATDGSQQLLLQTEFPALKFVKLSGYRITFSTNRGKTLIKILFQIPKILISINREWRWLKNFLLNNSVDVVISDNRYGFFSKEIVSIFITHQLTIKTPFKKVFEFLLRSLNYHYINKFSECWVPDFKGSDNMGGELSHPHTLPTIPLKFLGRLSRIVHQEAFLEGIPLLIILSGPEPQRSIFENILLAQLSTYQELSVMVRGLPGEAKPLENGQQNLSIYNHLPAATLNQYINKATVIISRSGYSTIMDLIGLGKKCIFVATPGQSEQEYLADYLASENLCLSYRQSKFSLHKAMVEAASHHFATFKQSESDQHQKIIDDLIKGLLLN